MTKTILVPTDLSIRSLHLLKHALNKSPSQPLDVIFFTGVVLKDSIVDLLFFSRQRITEGLITRDFKEACQIIRNKYGSRINGIRFEIFTGSTQAAFNNFTEGNRIDELYIPENKLHYKDRCFDPALYMKNSSLAKITVSWPEPQELLHENHLSELFTNWT